MEDTLKVFHWIFDDIQNVGCASTIAKSKEEAIDKISKKVEKYTSSCTVDEYDCYLFNHAGTGYDKDELMKLIKETDPAEYQLNEFTAILLRAKE